MFLSVSTSYDFLAYQISTGVLCKRNSVHMLVNHKFHTIVNTKENWQLKSNCMHIIVTWGFWDGKQVKKQRWWNSGVYNTALQLTSWTNWIFACEVNMERKACECIIIGKTVVSSFEKCLRLLSAYVYIVCLSHVLSF